MKKVYIDNILGFEVRDNILFVQLKCGTIMAGEFKPNNKIRKLSEFLKRIDVWIPMPRWISVTGLKNYG